MMNLQELLARPASPWTPLVLALLHSLWQAGLAAVLLALVLRLLRIKYSAARALLCGLAQTSILIAFLVTWALAAAPDRQPIPPATHPIQSPVAASTSPEPLNVQFTVNHAAVNPPVSPSPTPPLPNWPRLVALAWIAGALLMTLRMAHDLAAGWSLARAGTIASDELTAEANRLAGRLGLKSTIRVIASDGINTPAIFGILRPILLFPTAPLGLPPEQLEAILAHELAHIKRHDWLWHFIGRLIEAVLFYNPGVWWLGRMARREREAAADALAICVTQEPAVFATALAEWAERTGTPAKAAVAWNGDPGGLRERVLRVLKPTHHPHVRFSPLGVGVALLVALLMLAGLWGGTGKAVVVADELLSSGAPKSVDNHQSSDQASETEEATESANPYPRPKIRFRASGQISTADGVPLKESGRDGYGTLSINQEGYGYTGAVGPSGEFSAGTNGYGEEVTIVAQWLGYAPAVVGPASISSRDDWDNLKIVLERGFRGKLELLDHGGNRIDDAQVKVQLSEPASSQPRSLESGSNGLFILRHAAVHPYDVTVLAPGYERRVYENIKFKANGVASIKLTPTEPATGRITDRNGRPLENAKLWLHYQLHNTPTNRTSHGWGLTDILLDTTDADGRFSLTSLRADLTTVVSCGHPSHGMTLAIVAPGQEGIEIQLGPERILRGEVIGDLSTIKNPSPSGKDPTYSIGMTIWYLGELPGLPEYSGSSWSEPVDVIPDPASGNPPQRGTFEIRGFGGADSFPRGTIKIEAGETNTVVQPFDGIKNVTIKLPSAETVAETGAEKNKDSGKPNMEVQRPETIPFRAIVHVRTADGVPRGEDEVGTISVHQDGDGIIVPFGNISAMRVATHGHGKKVTIVVQWPGYAPSVVGPVPINSRDDWVNLQIALERGFPAELELNDPAGNPIDQAKVTARLSEPAESLPRSYKIGKDGRLIVEHAVARPYDVDVVAPGFERRTFEKVTLSPDMVTSLTLTPAEPTTGIVSGVNGQPLSGVEIRYVAEGALESTPVTLEDRWTLGHGPLMATTDEQGAFSLDTLPAEKVTIIVCEHDGAAPMVAAVQPGQENIQIQLEAERMLRGEVIGDLSKLSQWYIDGNQVPAIGYNIHFIEAIDADVPLKGGTTPAYAEVIPDPGSGNPPQRGTFEIRKFHGTENLPRGAITIRAGNVEKVIEPFDGVKEGVTIKLSGQ